MTDHRIGITLKSFQLNRDRAAFVEYLDLLYTASELMQIAHNGPHQGTFGMMFTADILRLFHSHRAAIVSICQQQASDAGYPDYKSYVRGAGEDPLYRSIEQYKCDMTSLAVTCIATELHKSRPIHICCN